MNKKLMGSAGLSLLLLFVGVNLVFAEDSVNIRVSCTVPAIPGVNAPLLEAQSSEIRQAIALKTDPNQPLPAIQEETETKDQSSEGEKDIVLVKTFYVR